jgi:DNA-binding transcriptional ArsR family regulator
MPETLTTEEKVARALSAQSRVKILKVLKRGRRAGLNITTITNRAELSQGTVSNYVAMLAEAGLVYAERDGRETIVTITEQGLQELKKLAA